ncbi:unnamed protein product [Cylicocyclus nassatus]|uniref:Uncharacterized protein n=1 Tax=Cylicocyclus nassatus TaxID=53992 RepID=A0AA36MDR3_CYLNA|nr:unnamed protein product [Cylicocyclus nassatus]
MLSAERASVFQLAIGFFGFINALNASLENAEKSATLQLYINTHWITTIVLFAGISRLVMIRSWIAEIFAVFLQLLCLCISVNAVIADLWNLRVLSYPSIRIHPKSNITLLTEETLTHVKTYNGIDSLLSLIAFILAAYIIFLHFNSSSNTYSQLPSVRLLGMGTALVALGVVRFFCYLREFFMLTGQDRVRDLFANYTLDEPAWIFTQLTLGILCVLAARGSKLMRALALSMAAATLMPSVFYLWLDYRWLASSRLSYVTESFPPHLQDWQVIGVIISFLNVGVVAATLLQLITMHSTWRSLTIDEKTKGFFIATAALFLLLSCSTISLDVYTIWKGLFYRLFQGAEQKTPFLTALTAIFAMTASMSKFAPIALPACVCLSLYSLNSTIFQMISYLYLSSNKYFGDQLCELFFPPSSRCFVSVTRREAIIHFIQVLLDFFVLILSSILCIVAMRISVMIKGSGSGVNRKLESPIRWLGVLMALCGLAVLLAALAYFGLLSSKDNIYKHPMVIVYVALYHIALAIGLIVFPLYQVICSEKLAFHPMSQTTLLIMSVVRFVEILTQLDYRGTGDELSADWKVHHIAEFIAMGSHFATAVLTIRLMGNSIEEPDADELRFNNPLTLEASGDYLQLRHQEET